LAKTDKEEIMTITRCTINGKPSEIINTNSFVDNDGYVHVPADYDTFDEYFADWFDSLPEE
jgi:hypothetical protein